MIDSRSVWARQELNGYSTVCVQIYITTHWPIDMVGMSLAHDVAGVPRNVVHISRQLVKATNGLIHERWPGTGTIMSCNMMLFSYGYEY